MKSIAAVAILVITLTGAASAKDHSNDYQMGTFVSATAVADGTITDTLHGDGTTVAGNVYANQVGIYRIDAADGFWTLETYRQAVDSTMRGWGTTPAHLRKEKANPLDSLKNGDKVLFRVEKHKKLLATETHIYIPYADKPDKEVDFLATFHPANIPAKPEKPTDNVKAMCDAHKLSPELEKQLCAVPASEPIVAPTSEPAPVPAIPVVPEMTKEETKSVKATPAELSDPRIARLKVMCEHGMITVPAVRQMSCDLYGFNYPGKPVEPDAAKQPTK
jgi:hypothetical protein